MTPEQLLKPRYKVIAAWPGMDDDITIGSIFMQYIEQDTVWRMTTPTHWTKVTVHNPEAYPHLFKKLQWWEDRGSEHYPEYIKLNTGEVCKPLKYRGDCAIINEANDWWYLHYCLPATQEDYNAYINQK